MPRTQKPPIGIRIDWEHPLSKGLVASWLMNENGGGTIYDSVNYPHGNNGALTNMANPPTATSGWNPGRVGSALSFDGVDDYVDLANESNFDFENTNSFSISAWIKTTQTVGSLSMIFGKYTSGYVGYFFATYNGTIVLQLQKTGYINKQSISTSVTNGVWHYVIGTYDGTGVKGGIKIYVDGVNNSSAGDSSGVLGSILNNNTAKIGKAEHPGGLVFNGLIDDVRIYNRALQPFEIQQLYSDPYCIYQQPRNVKYFVVSAKYSKTITENLAIQSQYQRSFGKQLIENLGFVDITPRGTDKSFSDTLLAIDGTIKSISRLLAANLLFLDSTLRSITKQFSDNLSFTDNRQIVLQRIFTELLECLDAYSKAIVITKQENLDLIDATIIIIFLELAKLFAREVLDDNLESKNIFADLLKSRNILSDFLEAKL